MFFIFSTPPPHTHTPEQSETVSVCMCNEHPVRDQRVRTRLSNIKGGSEQTGAAAETTALNHKRSDFTISLNPHVNLSPLTGLTTLAYSRLQNPRVTFGHLSPENLSRAQKHGLHGRALQQRDLILVIQRHKTCQQKALSNKTQ